MSTQEIGYSPFEAATPSVRRFAKRVITGAIAVVAGLARLIVEEAVYMFREDFKHGQIRREPEDWER
jgi:hypothetical protein